MISRGLWWTAGGAVLTLAAVLVTLGNPTLSLAIWGALALVALLALSRNSVPRLAILTIVLSIAVPLVNLPETVRFIAQSAIGAGVLILGARLARRRGRGTAWATGVVTLVLGLTVFNAVIAHQPLAQLDYFAGIGLAVTIGSAIILGGVMTEREARTLAAGFTTIAVAMALMAVVEAVRGEPLYRFTAFQANDNPNVLFRASALLGHPLVLGVFLSVAAAMTLVRPRWDHGRWWNSKFVVFSVLVVGAVSTGSRTVVLLLLVAIACIVLTRGFSFIRSLLYCALIAGGAFAAAQILDQSTLLARFGSLTESEQYIRLSGVDTLNRITSDAEWIVGAGPRAVARAYATSDGTVTFGTLDNQFLTTIAEYGYIGLAGLILLILALVVGLRRRTLGPWVRSYVPGGLVIAASFAVMDPLAWWVLAFLFGLAVGGATSKQLTPPVRRHVSRNATRGTAEVVP